MLFKFSNFIKGFLKLKMWIHKILLVWFFVNKRRVKFSLYNHKRAHPYGDMLVLFFIIL